MAYCIHYDGEYIKTPIYEKKRAVLVKMLVASLLVIAIFVGAIFCIQGGLYKYLLPGDPKVTEAALLGFVENIGNGCGFVESAEAFCRLIIDNATVRYE